MPLDTQMLPSVYLILMQCAPRNLWTPQPRDVHDAPVLSLITVGQIPGVKYFLKSDLMTSDRQMQKRFHRPILWPKVHYVGQWKIRKYPTSVTKSLIMDASKWCQFYFNCYLWMKRFCSKLHQNYPFWGVASIFRYCLPWQWTPFPHIFCSYIYVLTI